MMMDLDIHSVIGCDGSLCQSPDAQVAYTLDDMPNVAFCKTCWTQEMSRRKRTGQGEILPFPGTDNRIREMHVPHLQYPGFDGASATFEKIRRSMRLEE